jgi:hypothetical protein
MNPWAVVLILLGAMLIIVGFHGSQHGLMATVKGGI